MTPAITPARARFYDNPLIDGHQGGHCGGLQHDMQTLARKAPGRREALRWLALGGGAPLGFLGAATGARADVSSDAAIVFAWAETTYPDLFSPAAASQVNSSFVFRHYAGTDNYLGVGVSDKRLYAFGRDTGYQLLDLGALATWLSAATGVVAQTCSLIPEETNGPYPADGSNSVGNRVVNALTLSGIVRSDIRASIAGATGVAQGIPLTLEFELVNSSANCATLEGYAIYAWHCTRDGLYSMYSAGVTGENYLRGVQATSSSGIATFQTIFPGCYSGRMPHVHFEVYRSLATATSSTQRIRTSQMAFPVDVCKTVYATSGYEASVQNLSRISFATDNVFGDGYSTQLASVTGSTASGYLAKLRVGVSG